MLFDGDCSFCRRWVQKAQKWTHINGEEVRYASYQEAVSRYPQITPQQCTKSVHLILHDGTVFAGAHAIFKALDLSDRCPLLLRLYENSPLCAYLAEWVYRIVAGHRDLLSRFM